MAESGARPNLTVPTLVQILARTGTVRARGVLADAGMADLRPMTAQALVPLLGGGRHASELATTLRVSRQAVAQMVANLERGGYVERVDDPGDARAKLICLTARGRAAVRVLWDGSRALEEEWAELLGRERLQELRSMLATLLGHAERMFG